jgi:hypothetical protein
LGLGTPHNKIQEKESPTRRKKNIEKMNSVRKTNPDYNKRRTLERQRKISRSGVTSIRAPGITLMIVTQRSHWW